jgi:hypothetical protein
MVTPMPNKKCLVIIGATGMVGGYALRFRLEDSAVISVMAIGRRPLGISHPKLNEVIHQDLSDCSGLAEPLSGQDATIFCLGVYTGAVSDTQLHDVTVDYPIEFARVLHLSSPDSAFSFPSRSGADQSGRSRMAFARYKGEAETALLRTGFSRVYIPTRIHLPCGAPQGAEPWVQSLAHGLSRVSDSFPESSHSCR